MKTSIEFPHDYAERVYAGVLGKIIGVYLGRPFEGWSYERLTERFGAIEGYVHEQLNARLIVADDDISGTFTFIRALEDYGFDPKLTPEQIGQTWLNYIIQNRTILWWGGMGTSTEHTAYLRLKHGVKAPRSGSIALNSRVVAEQIGAQIFIDGWGLICPGDPGRAADFARRAASVSHDGEAVHGAQVVAALVASAFVEQDIDRMLDIAVSVIPQGSIIAALISDLREWHASEKDWRVTRSKIAGKYGYDRYGGGCHIVPNHALIIHALLHGGGDFSESLKIVNTCGWDTDCNSGNVGCILAVRNGLASLSETYDWRGPVADRIYLPTADGGRCITDAVRESRFLVDAAYRLRGAESPVIKDDARFTFPFPGSVQGFQAESDSLIVANPEGDGLVLSGMGSLSTPTFVPIDDISVPGYSIVASPTLYSGQIVRAWFSGVEGTVACLAIGHYDVCDTVVIIYSPNIPFSNDKVTEFEWTVPDTGGLPICSIGVKIGINPGSARLESLTWDGAPTISFPVTGSGSLWRSQWVQAVDQFGVWGPNLSLCQNEGRGLVSIGTREWTDYTLSAVLKPHMVLATGLAVRYQGLERYYAVLLCSDNFVRLVKRLEGETLLGETEFELILDREYALDVKVSGTGIEAWIDNVLVLSFEDQTRPFLDGAIAIVVDEGRVNVRSISVSPNS